MNRTTTVQRTAAITDEDYRATPPVASRAKP